MGPQRALEAVHDFLGLELFAHDFENVAYEADEFDRRLGAPGLHRAGCAVRLNERSTVLPPDLFARLEGDSFWLDPARYTRGVRVV